MPASSVTVSATFKESAAQKTAGSISYTTTTVSKTTTDSAFTNTLTNTGDGAVSYASSNTEVATVDASTGAVTIVAAGTTTITATVTDSDTYTYATKTASYTLTVSVAGGTTIDLASIPASALTNGNTLIVANGTTLTGTLSQDYKIQIADGATVTLDGVVIRGLEGNFAGITCPGDATIILKDGSENTVCGAEEDDECYWPGIWIAPEKTLIIKGTGQLSALRGYSNYFAAGIGAGCGHACGNIEIQGGVITAEGGDGYAGIGGGITNECGTITISGGVITAVGGSRAAGIGSGEGGSCGNITISGGTITATGGNKAAGIGSGTEGIANSATVAASCGNITITTGVTSVTATKGSNAPNSIGAGYHSECGTVTIGVVEGAVETSPYTYQPGAPAVTVRVTAITLNKTATTITKVNDTATETLSVTAVTPAEATDKTYTWSSDAESVATVDADGKVTAVAAGTAHIRATANDGSGVYGECTVTVSDLSAYYSKMVECGCDDLRDKCVNQEGPFSITFTGQVLSAAQAIALAQAKAAETSSNCAVFYDSGSNVDIAFARNDGTTGSAPFFYSADDKGLSGYKGYYVSK